jgi:hypothetical protein
MSKQVHDSLWCWWWVVGGVGERGHGRVGGKTWSRIPYPAAFQPYMLFLTLSALSFTFPMHVPCQC